MELQDEQSKLRPRLADALARMTTATDQAEKNAWGAKKYRLEARLRVLNDEIKRLNFLVNNAYSSATIMAAAREALAPHDYERLVTRIRAVQSAAEYADATDTKQRKTDRQTEWLLTKPNPLACYQCLLRYGGGHWIEAVVANDVWERISPTGNEGGILCINCMADRLQRLGLHDVPVKLTAGPLIAQGIETRSAIDAKRRGPEGESPVAKPCAQK
jgi:hypothetical protein